MTIGDVLAVIAVVLVIGVGWGATILLTVLAFPARVSRVQAAVTTAPGVCLLRGLGTFLATVILAGILHSSPAGPVKLLAGSLLAGAGLLAALGSAGIVRLVSERIAGMGQAMPPFAALTRATVLYVAAGYLPVIGWFCVLPLALLLSLGAGVTALRGQRAARTDAVLPRLKTAA